MGNCSDKDDEDVIVQPMWLGDMPDPYPMSKIQPELIVFRNDRMSLEVSYDKSSEEVVDLLVSSDLLAESRIVFITHGFRSDKNTEWLHRMKDKMVVERDQTIVILGWGKGADIGIASLA